MKALSSLLPLFAKRAYARYRFIAGHGNTPCLSKVYYHTRLPNDIAHSSAWSWGVVPFMVRGSLYFGDMVLNFFAAFAELRASPLPSLGWLAEVTL
jgi:hypothetical protein